MATNEPNGGDETIGGNSLAPATLASTVLTGLVSQVVNTAVGNEGVTYGQNCVVLSSQSPAALTLVHQQQQQQSAQLRIPSRQAPIQAQADTSTDQLEQILRGGTANQPVALPKKSVSAPSQQLVLNPQNIQIIRQQQQQLQQQQQQQQKQQQQVQAVVQQQLAPDSSGVSSGITKYQQQGEVSLFEINGQQYLRSNSNGQILLISSGPKAASTAPAKSPVPQQPSPAPAAKGRGRGRGSAEKNAMKSGGNRALVGSIAQARRQALQTDNPLIASLDNKAQKAQTKTAVVAPIGAGGVGGSLVRTALVRPTVNSNAVRASLPQKQPQHGVLGGGLHTRPRTAVVNVTNAVPITAPAIQGQTRALASVNKPNVLGGNSNSPAPNLAVYVQQDRNGTPPQQRQQLCSSQAPLMARAQSAMSPTQPISRGQTSTSPVHQGSRSHQGTPLLQQVTRTHQITQNNISGPSIDSRSNPSPQLHTTSTPAPSPVSQQPVIPKINPTSHIQLSNEATSIHNTGPIESPCGATPGQGWVKGQEYVIKYSNGRQVMGEWDGKYFKVKTPVISAPIQSQGAPQTSPQASPSLGQPNGDITPGSAQKPQMGGGSPRSNRLNKAVLPQPNVTPNRSLPSPNDLPRARTPASLIDSQETSNSGSEASEGLSQRASQKRPFKQPEDGKFAVCENCGHVSADYNICDSCKKPMPEEPKYFHPKKVMKKSDEPLSVQKAELTKAQFYGESNCIANAILAQKLVDGKRVVAIRNKKPASKGSQAKGKATKKQPQQPETVTILSSSDDESGEGHHRHLHTPSSFPEDALDELPSPHAHNIMMSRKLRMEDESGKVVRGGKQKKEEGEGMDPFDVEGPLTLQLHDVRIGTLRSESAEPLVITTQKFTIKFTTHVDKQKFNMVLAVTEIERVDACLGTRRGTIFLHTSKSCGQKIRDGCRLTQTKGPYFDPCSKEECFKYIILTVNTTAKGSAEKLRSMCNAITADRTEKGSWGDGQSFITEMSQSALNQRMMICTTALASHSDKKQVVRMSRNQEIVQTAFQLLVSPTAGGGEQYVIQHWPGQLPEGALTGDNMEEGEEEELMDRSRSPSPFHPVFNAPIVKLFTYPPPPATGGITVTNEDLFCLNEGEFLNDVIIDFYLKYLFMEILSEEQRERSHVFSSFFYRRLTQKQSKRQAGEEAANMSVPERRHARVKTWTRHVDLFKKDYIIVPINESAHWYLAIICFPWLREPVYASYPNSPQPMSGSQIPMPSPQPAESSSLSEAAPSPQPWPCSQPATLATQKASSISQQGMTSHPPSSPSPQPGVPISQTHSESADSITADGEKAEGNDIQTQSNEQSQQQQTDGSTSAVVEKMETDKPTTPSNGEPSTCLSVPAATESCPIGRASAANLPNTVPKGKYIARQPCILIFDSLSGLGRSGVVRTLREYLQVEWNVRKAEQEGPVTFDKDNMRGANPRCPQQTNFSDCGIYVLQYVETFFMRPIIDYSIPMKHLTNWFEEAEAKVKREELRVLILGLQEELNPMLDYDPMMDGCMPLPLTPEAPLTPAPEPQEHTR